MDKLLKIAVCEDVPEDAARLREMIAGSGVEADMIAYDNGEGLLGAFYPGRFDAVFMDIYMGGMSGVEAAAQIRKADGYVTLAFTTMSLDYTLESYRLGALKYIEKPVTPKAVRDTLELARLRQRARPFVTLPVTGRDEVFYLDTVMYFEQKEHNVIIQTTNGTHRASRGVKLADITELLPKDTFCHCHHSYIVNLRHVCDIDKELTVFKMRNGDTVYIKRLGFKKARDAYEALLFSEARGGKL